MCVCVCRLVGHVIFMGLVEYIQVDLSCRSQRVVWWGEKFAPGHECVQDWK